MENENPAVLGQAGLREPSCLFGQGAREVSNETLLEPFRAQKGGSRELSGRVLPPNFVLLEGSGGKTRGEASCGGLVLAATGFYRVPAAIIGGHYFLDKRGGARVPR
jgi:hypothetical protein